MAAFIAELVGVTGFEPTTVCVQTSGEDQSLIGRWRNLCPS